MTTVADRSHARPMKGETFSCGASAEFQRLDGSGVSMPSEAEIEFDEAIIDLRTQMRGVEKVIPKLRSRSDWRTPLRVIAERLMAIVNNDQVDICHVDACAADEWQGAGGRSFDDR